jgi:hypothetical protein
MPVTESETQLADAWNMPTKVGEVFAEKMKSATETFNERIRKSQDEFIGALSTQPITPMGLWQTLYKYTIDLAERSVLFWDTLRQRGNNWIEHERAGHQVLFTISEVDSVKMRNLRQSEKGSEAHGAGRKPRGLLPNCPPVDS